jgi:endonuclease/exonuclease/phosphatase family metal-dependent hydrolase
VTALPFLGEDIMARTLCTFNANNLYARYRFSSTFPGDLARKSLVENSEFGYLPEYRSEFIELFNEEQRELAARAITDDGKSYPDVLCLQEVESMLALRRFNEEYLKSKYPYALLVDSRDFRQIDVAILSKLEIVAVRTHVDDLDEKPDNPKRPWLFSRDCLEVELALNKSGSKRLTLFINHLKSKFATSAAERERGDKLRTRQAEELRKIVRQQFPGSSFNEKFFVVVGDLNDEPASKTVRSIVHETGLVDAMTRIATEQDRWTHWFRSENIVSQLDYLLLSPALAAATDGESPRIERRAIGFARVLADGKPGPRFSRFHRRDEDPNPIQVDFRFPRFAQVTPQNAGSDHCPVFLRLP